MPILYGLTGADLGTDSNGNVRPGAVGTLYTAMINGSVYAGTYAYDGTVNPGANTAGTITADANGRVAFWADTDEALWLDFHDGKGRWGVNPTNPVAVAKLLINNAAEASKIATQIPSGVDLNTYVITGNYHQTSTAGALAGTNYPPDPRAGLLIVWAGASTRMVYQLFIKYAGEAYDPAVMGNVYWRSKYGTTDANGTWMAWRQLNTPPPDLITGLKYPITLAHRGGGADIHPEESREGFAAAARSNFALEMDVRPLADGTPVGCHDSTATRTMSLTGNVNSFTLAQWRAARINSPMPGGKTGTTILFEDLLDTYGGHHLITPETYDATTTATCINMVKARRLERAVIGQSFNFDLAAQWAAAGIEASMACGTTVPTQGWAGLKAAKINYIGVDLAMSQANITAAKAAGLKVFAYTAHTKIEHDAQIAKGVDGVFSDDPWGTTGRVQRSLHDQFYLDHRPHGLYAYGTRASVGAFEGLPLAVQPSLIGNGIGWSTGTSGNDVGYQRAVSLPWVGPLSRPVMISALLSFHPITSGQSNNIGFSITSSSDGLWHDNAFAGQNGYTFCIRRSGTVQGWKYVNGAAAASIGTATTTAEVAPSGQAAEARLTVIIGTASVTMIGESAVGRAVLAVADATPLVNANLFLRWSAQTGSISDVRVSPVEAA